MQTFPAGLVGSMILVLLGNGVIADVARSKAKGNSAGWLAAVGSFPWRVVPAYLLAQLLGAMRVRVFCIGTAMLVCGILATAATAGTLVRPGDIDLSVVFSRALQPLLAGLLVPGIGLSLGPTGYAINPARDPGPRIAYALLPIPDARAPNRPDTCFPIVGPISAASPARPSTGGSDSQPAPTPA